MESTLSTSTPLPGGPTLAARQSGHTRFFITISTTTMQMQIKSG